jgi:hypothetical protein
MPQRAEYVDSVVQAEQKLAAISDPELRRIAFQKVLEDLRTSALAKLLEATAKQIQVLAVVVGVIVSVVSFTFTTYMESQKRKAEAIRPFLELQQKLYLEAAQVAGVLANPKTHSHEELARAKRRFRELYVSELSMVEGRGVETKMKDLAALVDPELRPMTPEQRAAYDLAHALRLSLAKSWVLNDDVVELEE